MRRKLFTLGKTSVYLHLATLLFAGYMVLLGRGSFLRISIASILLHETAHSLVAAAFGHPPGEVEITPLGALMRLDDESDLPVWKRLLILAAGPAMSLGLCWVAIELTKAGVLSSQVGKAVFSCNAALFVLNLLPALPLDGGRLLALLLGAFLEPGKVRKTLQILGSAIGCGLIGIDLVLCFWAGSVNFSLCMAGCFLLYAAAVGTRTQAMAELRRLMDRKIRLEQRGALHGCVAAVTENTPLHQAIGQLSERKYTLFCILETGTMRLLTTAGEESMISLYFDKPWAQCGEVMQRG